MKLLYCTECHGVFSLRWEVCYCPCGKTSGQYKDNLNAVYSGPAVPLGFVNRDFKGALENQPEDPYAAGEEFTAFVIPDECPTIKRLDKK